MLAGVHQGDPQSGPGTELAASMGGLPPCSNRSLGHRRQHSTCARPAFGAPATLVTPKVSPWQAVDSIVHLSMTIMVQTNHVTISLNLAAAWQRWRLYIQHTNDLTQVHVAGHQRVR